MRNKPNQKKQLKTHLVPARHHTSRHARDMSTTVVFVRHGQSVFNAEHRIQGQLDLETPLDADGVAQVARAAPVVARIHGDAVAVYSSDLTRARDTARGIADALGVDVSLDARLRERHLGDLQGLPRADLRALAPEAFVAWKSGGKIPGGGESAAECDARLVEFFKFIASAHGDGEKVIAVTHGGVLGRLFARGANASDKRLCSMRRGVTNLGECVVHVRQGGIEWECDYAGWASGRFLENADALTADDA